MAKKVPKGKIIDAVANYRALAARLKKPPLSKLTFSNLATVADTLKMFKKKYPEDYKKHGCWAHIKWGG